MNFVCFFFICKRLSAKLAIKKHRAPRLFAVCKRVHSLVKLIWIQIN